MRFICLECLKEPYLRQTLQTEQQVCDYCEMNRACAGLFDVAYECDRVLDTHFEPAHLDNAVVIYERDPPGSTLEKTLGDLNVVRSEAIDDLVEDLNFLWFDRHSMENKYSLENDGDEPWFRLRADLGEPISDAWYQMNKSLQQEARYVNPAAMRVLETVLGNMDADHTDDGQTVVIVAGPDTALKTLFRARVFQLEQHLTEALGHPARLLGTPAPGIGQAGRMNAKGQPAFYGATTVDVAMAEVRPPVGAWVATAAFEFNVALFARASGVAGASGMPLGRVYLWGHDEGDTWIAPRIVELRSATAPAADGFDDVVDFPSTRPDHSPETLKLVKVMIAIHEITGIQISHRDHQVRVQP